MEEATDGSYVPSTSYGQPQQQPQEPWKMLGRDTPAGKALFKLYGGDFVGKGVGNKFNDRNKQIYEQKVAAGWSPPPKEKPAPVIEKPTVIYPRFGSAKSAPPSREAPIHRIPHRKPCDVIMKELEEEKERQKAQRPAPKGPLLDEREKDRCANLMRYRGKPPEVTPAELAAIRAARAARKPKTEKEELQDMFDQVMSEIEERRAFLADMEASGALKKDVQIQIRNEIKQRVEDLEKLDKLIKSCVE